MDRDYLDLYAAFETAVADYIQRCGRPIHRHCGPPLLDYARLVLGNLLNRFTQQLGVFKFEVGDAHSSRGLYHVCTVILAADPNLEDCRIHLLAKKRVESQQRQEAEMRRLVLGALSLALELVPHLEKVLCE